MKFCSTLPNIDRLRAQIILDQANNLHGGRPENRFTLENTSISDLNKITTTIQSFFEKKMERADSVYVSNLDQANRQGLKARVLAGIEQQRNSIRNNRTNNG